MKPAPLLVIIPLLFPLASLGALPLTKPELRADGRYEFRDRTVKEKFRIAMDELQESGGGVHRRVPVTARNHLRKIQETAKELSGGGRKFDLIAYPEGKPQTEANRRVVTNKVSVTLNEGIDPTPIGLAIKAVTMKPLVYLPFDYIMTFADATEALTAAETLRDIPGVLKSEVLLARQMVPAFIPNDPLFKYSGGPFLTEILADLAELPAAPIALPVLVGRAATRGYQWYLNWEESLKQLPLIPYATHEDRDLPPWQNPNVRKRYPRYFETAIDLNVIPAWDEKGPTGKLIDGAGVKVGLLDDGVQLNPIHPDLNRDNILFSDDYNFIDGDASKNDPTPPGPAINNVNSHGTAVAGLVLANRNNLQMTGVAPGAKLAAYRVAGGFVDPADFADAMTFGSKLIPTPVSPTNPLGIPTGNEWRSGPIRFDIGCIPLTDSTYGADLFGLNLYLRKALTYGVTEGRGGLGIIYVVPAGNDGEEHGDTNYSGYTNSLYTIKVGATTDLGRRAAYSTPGASLHVVAPSSGGEVSPRILVGAKLEPTLLRLTDTVPDKTLPPTFYGPAVPDAAWRRAMGYTTSPDNYDSPISDRRNTQQLVSLRGPETTTENFGGSSAACALASGVVALMLEANPGLGWRDVQEILMRSASVIDAAMGEWQYNSLGMAMSHKYGAGVIDAAHAVRMAKVWRNLGARVGPTGGGVGTIGYKEVKGEAFSNGSNRLITDNMASAPPVIPNKIVAEIALNAPSSGLRIEHIVVRMKVVHGRRGDLGVILSGPATGQADRPVESFLLVPHREDTNADIGLPGEVDSGGDAGEVEGEYWDFSTVRHWGTGVQNSPLNAEVGGTEGWKLIVWDNTNKPKTNPVGGAAAITAARLNPASNPEDRVYAGVDNPVNNTTAVPPVVAKIVYAEVRYHGSGSPSENEPPVITNGGFTAVTGAAFKSKIFAETDLSLSPLDNTERAPIFNYRVRVLKTLTPNTPDLVIAPATPRDYRLSFPIVPPATMPPPGTASLRFDRITGVLSNEPYPREASHPDYPIPPFIPLVKGSWQLELQATSIFGSTRKIVTYTVDEPLRYNVWRNIKFSPAERDNPAISGDNADPDGDGIANLLEYGMGGEPKKNEAVTLQPTTTVQGGNLIYRYKVDTTAQQYVITPQVSSDLDPLDSWTTLAPSTAVDYGQITTREVSIRIEPGKRQFIRLRMALP